MRILALILALAIPLVSVGADQQLGTPTTWPLHIAAPSGEVILPGPRDKAAYDRYGYAPVRRAGSMVYISGIVIGRRPGEGADVAAFKDEVRRGFRRIETCLKAAGLTFDDIVMINSFHVWAGPDFKGSKSEQFDAFEKVKEEFMKGPKPAWTAVGTTGLLGEGGIVEVQIIAQVPDTRH